MPRKESLEIASEAVPNDVDLLSLIRELFKNPKFTDVEEGIQALILPQTDAHQNEYLAENDMHVKFISGFGGSNALAVITREDALLWTDGRYYDQAEKELFDGWKLMKDGSITPVDWICQNLSSADAVGFNPHLFSIIDGRSLVKKLGGVKMRAVPLRVNLVDALWTSRGAPTNAPRKILALDALECGASVASKVEYVRDELRRQKCDTLVLTLLDDIAWLLNIRGSDIPYNPVVYAIVILNFTDVFLFVDERKIAPEIAAHLHAGDVKMFSYGKAVEFLDKYHRQFREQSPTHRIWLTDATNYALASVVDDSFAFVDASPIRQRKCVKNEAELAGIRNAGIRDSAAIVQFLLWLKREMELGHHVTEERAAKQMNYYRSKLPGFFSLSFRTISAVGKNAANAHYTHEDGASRRLLSKIPPEEAARQIADSFLPAKFDTQNSTESTPKPKTDEKMSTETSGDNAETIGKMTNDEKTNSSRGNSAAIPLGLTTEKSDADAESLDTIYLIDSGAHYRDGTTDVTRTVHVGANGDNGAPMAVIDAQFRRMFTLVLRAHIELAMSIFPRGTTGIRLDSIARRTLWRFGYDFEHGVGHGVGHFLNVHEYPPYVGYRRPDLFGIQPCMVYTIEPGYYESGRFGIRIENVYETVAVQPDEIPSGAANFVRHVPLTWVPIQKDIIVRELLEPEHIKWLNGYHNKCLELVGKYLQEYGLQEEYNFLAECCTPL